MFFQVSLFSELTESRQVTGKTNSRNYWQQSRLPTISELVVQPY